MAFRRAVDELAVCATHAPLGMLATGLVIPTDRDVNLGVDAFAAADIEHAADQILAQLRMAQPAHGIGIITPTVVAVGEEIDGAHPTAFQHRGKLLFTEFGANVLAMFGGVEVEVDLTEAQGVHLDLLGMDSVNHAVGEGRTAS